MRAFQVFSLLGGLLLVIGVYLLIPSSPLTASHNGTIDVGANVYLYDKFNVFQSGHLGGQFSESQGQPLRVYVFTDSQYSTFTTGNIPQGLFSSDGPSSGSFSVSIPSPGNYYLIFMHGVSFASSPQTISFSVSLDGYNPVVLASGFGSLAAGAASFFIGYRLRNKYLDEKATPKASDVVMFDKPSSTTLTGTS